MEGLVMGRSILLEPIRLGEIQLPNRIVMASMTRARTENPGLVPIPLQAEYYRQRASAGLILTEGTWPSKAAIGAVNVPGLFNSEQAEGWKRVTEAVHEAGGRIAVQLGHIGAASHPDLLGGEQPIGPSAISMNCDAFTPTGPQPVPVPRAMTIGDIHRTAADYASATRFAREAGFDGVELHGISGYLIPQFLSELTNQRSDEYGGSVENRVRFPLEVLEAMVSQWSAGRIGMKLSPGISMGTIVPTEATLPTYEHLVSRMSDMQLAWIQFLNPVTDLLGAPADLTDTPVAALQHGSPPHFRRFFAGPIIANGSLTKETAEAVIEGGDADAAAFGALYLSNPDLVERFALGLPLAPIPSKDTWYAGGETGYADYPRALEAQATQPK
jgi:N-ethylmaleimide reductase